jgi:hypothetical protein
MRGPREKVFGTGRQVPLDRNAKARITAYARAWDRRHRQPGQRGGALGRAALDVLGALATKAGCARSTVAEAIKALEFAGVLTWQNRIVRVRERCPNLWGKAGWQWRVVRTSNAYVFRDPQQRVSGLPVSKSDQRTGTSDQQSSKPVPAPAIDPRTPLERALARFGAALAAKTGIEQAAAS